MKTPIRRIDPPNPSTKKYRSRFAPYFFLAPFLILFTLFVMYPLVQSIRLSLFKVASPRTMQYVGLGNFKFLLRDLAFWGSVANTAYFAVAFLFFEIPFSLILAIALNSPKIKGRNLLRFAFLSSHLVGNVFVSIIFGLLLTPRHGLINKVIGTVFPAIGTEIQWTNKPSLAMPAIVLTALWLSVGYAMIYFLAALQNVEKELYEAAEVDGADRWTKFWHITLPGIMPVARYLILVGLVAAFQMFELPYILFNQSAGPAGRGITVVMYLYMMGFTTGDLGYASAVGWMLVFILIFITALQWRAIRSITKISLPKKETFFN